MSPPVTAADLVFMTSERLAAIVADALAELAERGEIALVPAAQAQRLGGEE